MRSVATSTIAMTLYNILAGERGARSIEEIAPIMMVWAKGSGIEVSEPQLFEALTGLAIRGFVRAFPNGLFDVRDPKRRPVVQRERSGDGWQAWRVHSTPAAAVSMTMLEDVVR